jgi:glyoxylase-like metal-dependent hydrolase (beta-lactamase superfamily II)
MNDPKIFLLILSVFFANSSLSKAHDVTAPASIEHFSFEQISKNIHVIHGSQILPNEKTRGFMNNPAIVTTKKGVIVIDPGSSKQIGLQLVEKIKSVTSKPVIAVFNTHLHGDHWLGNHGIREIYPEVPIYAHRRMIERVDKGEGQDYIDIFLNLTKQATAGTRVVRPDIGLKGGETLNFDGVSLRIYHTGHAHTDSDIMIEVVEDKSLFFGDIVASKRVPNSDVPRDANFKGTIHAIKTMLKESPATIYIPGHGHTGGREVPEASLKFLTTLNNSVTRYFNQGLSDYEMKDKVIQDLVEFRNWNNFNEIGRVISHLYQEVERDNF